MSISGIFAYIVIYMHIYERLENRMAQFTNQAQIRYGNSVVNSNIAVGEILEVLSASKTALRDTYGQNDRITYIISIVNSGTSPVTGLSISDDLGAYPFGIGTLTPLSYLVGTIKYYVNGALQSAPSIEAGPPLTVSGISVPANGNAVIVYEVAVNEAAPLRVDSEITNRVTISGGGAAAPITAEETIYAESAPILTITKSVSPVPVAENGVLTYTFQIQNSGNIDADVASGIVVTDQFDPILTNLTVTYNGTALIEGTDYTYEEDTGAFATITGKITVPAATFSQDPTTGDWVVNPGSGTLVITGTV